MDRDRWLSSFAQACGSPAPSPAEIAQLLKLAAVAAHASERTAAPLTCWMAARSQMPLTDLLGVAASLAEDPSRQG